MCIRDRANVVKSDKIYFLKDGEIKESGKHDELMSQNGAYRHLYESQMALDVYKRQDEMLLACKYIITPVVVLYRIGILIQNF